MVIMTNYLYNFLPFVLFHDFLQFGVLEDAARSACFSVETIQQCLWSYLELLCFKCLCPSLDVFLVSYLILLVYFVYIVALSMVCVILSFETLFIIFLCYFLIGRSCDDIIWLIGRIYNMQSTPYISRFNVGFYN